MSVTARKRKQPEPPAPPDPRAAPEPSDPSEVSVERSQKQRRLNNKTASRQVIQVALGGRLRSTIYPRLRPWIERMVQVVSLATHKASQVLNAWLLYALNYPGTISAPDLACDTTYHQCLNIGIGQPDNSDLQFIWDSFFAGWPVELFELNGEALPSGNLLSDAAIKMKTNVKANLVEHLVGRVLKFWRVWVQEWCRRQGVDPKSRPWCDLPFRLQRAALGWTTREPWWTSLAILAPQHNDVFVLEATIPLHAISDRLQLVPDGPPSSRGFSVKAFQSPLRLPALVDATFFLLRYLESIPDTKRDALLPQASLGRHFIAIDAKTLHALAVHTGAIAQVPTGVGRQTRQEATAADVTADPLPWFRRLFDVERLQGPTKKQAGWKFAGRLETDGVVVSVHFERPGGAAGSAPVLPPLGRSDYRGWISATSLAPDTVLLGVDPGRVNMLTVALATETKQEDDNKDAAAGPPLIHSWTLTRRQYYHEGGINHAQKQTRRWLQPVAAAQDLLAAHPGRTTQFSAFLGHLQALQSVLPELWRVHWPTHWSRLTFRTTGLKRSVIDRFLNRLPQGTALAYGNAKFASSGRGEQAVPTDSLAAHCQRRFPCVSVDEFHTSQRCACCQEQVASVYRLQADQVPEEKEPPDPDHGPELPEPSAPRAHARRLPVRDLKWCGSTTCKAPAGSRPVLRGRLLNRDVNAALNIRARGLRLRAGLPEPAMWSRGQPALAKLSHRITSSLLFKDSCRLSTRCRMGLQQVHP